MFFSLSVGWHQKVGVAKYINKLSVACLSMAYLVIAKNAEIIPYHPSVTN